MTDSADSLERTAYHEAGHAYLAVYLGAKLDSLTIDPDWDDGPARFGDAAIRWELSQFSAEKLLQNQVRVCLAGPVAERIYAGETTHPAKLAAWSADWKMAWNLAARLLPSPQQRLNYLERVVDDLDRLFNRDEHWDALSAVVDLLLAHETLTGEEIEEVLQQWL